MKQDDTTILPLPDTSGNPEALPPPQHDQAAFASAFWRVIAYFPVAVSLSFFIISLFFYTLSLGHHNQYSSPTHQSTKPDPAPLFANSLSRQSFGLFELSMTGNETTVDVVAIHGLQGDAYKTWEHDDGSLWLRDFLPADIPFARIMTFGYDSTIAFSKSVAKIEDKALELLNQLSAKRSSSSLDIPPKPIVFVSHSLGGIVVKKALIIAHERSSDPEYKDILENTRAIAFLGVPHKGSDSAWWAAFAANALKGASIGSSTNTALVSDLKKDSTTLSNISKQFIDRARELLIYTFFETERLHGVVVVDERSALIGLPNEKLFPVNANHRTICKISSPKSHEYGVVGFWIARLVKQSLKDATSVAEKSKGQWSSHFEVPNRRVSGFVGREDVLQKIDKALSSGSSPFVAVLQGIGGQGKSQVALEYCHRKKNNPYSAIFWIDAANEETVKGRFHYISESIKKRTDYLPDMDARVTLVLQYFFSLKNRWLLVFDNYDNPDDFPNIQDFIPEGKLGAILVTSRHASSHTLVINQSDHFIELLGLEEEAAVSLLTQQSQTNGSDSEVAKTIVKRLGRHALAITQAGAYIRIRNLRLRDFTDHYKRRKRMILENTPKLSQYRKKLGNSDRETSLNVFTTWELSFHQLEPQSLENDYRAKLLTLFAFLDNRDISEQLFAEFTADYDQFPESAKLLVWLNVYTNASGQWESDLFVDTLISLRDLSLLQGFAQEPDGFYHLSLHPLIKDWICLRTDLPISQENIIMASALVRGMLLKGLTLSAKLSIVLHVAALEESNEELLNSQADMFSNNLFLDEYASTQSLFASFLREVNVYNLAATICQRGATQTEKIFGPEHPRVLLYKANLVSIYLSQGRWNEARELQVSHMETTKRVLGLEHPDTLTSIINRASMYWRQGRWNEAKELQVSIMETTKRVFGLEHLNTLLYMNNLAIIYWSQGRWNEAKELQVSIMETTKRVLELEHPKTLLSMSNFASSYESQGRWKGAEELQVPVMEIGKKVLGLEHPNTLLSISDLALTYWSQGRWNEAEELEVSIMETTKRVLGLEHPSTLLSMSSLALIYWSQGLWNEAEELDVAVMETKKRVLRFEHPETLLSISNLASIYWSQGRWKEAEELQMPVMETTKRVLGLEHPDTLLRMSNLALTYWSQRQWNEAEELQMLVMEIRNELLGREHPDTLASMSNLALTYWSQGRWNEAEELEVAAMETRKRVVGLEHPHTLFSIRNLASIYWSQGRWNEAEKLQVQVMETRKRVLGLEHPDTLLSMSNLASTTYWSQSRWNEAEELEIEVMETRMRVLGLEHPDTLLSISDLALTYWSQGRWNEAEELQVQVMKTRKRVLGLEHPDTLLSISNLASTYRSQGRGKEAQELYQCKSRTLETRQRLFGI